MLTQSSFRLQLGPRRARASKSPGNEYMKWYPRFRRNNALASYKTGEKVWRIFNSFTMRGISVSVILGCISAFASGAIIENRATGGYVQTPSGSASFTMYSGCGTPACGIKASGFTAAINQLSFGSGPGLGAGDACGRCFALTGTADPFSPNYTGPFGQSIVVKVTDLCPVAGNQQWCGQTTSNQKNQFAMPFHFDICEDTGGSAVFFPNGHGALTGSFTEVSCSSWSGSDGSPLWNGACLSGEKAANWPSAVGCGNQGTAPS
ncbi:RlpA-like double-psi beta-barrel-protein domain-containing protein-containing protein [Mycena floridula]|nr:RlpA-like double-psi beta-barrel-protein domain-containing protein-containing protein [Mycena floridula]